MLARYWRVLAFDSGIGGLGVTRALRPLLPESTRVDYLADNALFPYGEQPDATLLLRIVNLIERQIRQNDPDLVVIACNTASTLALSALRAKFDLPFVGVVPPVRWAARESKTRVFGILATAATARRPYLQTLRDDFASDCVMIVHGGRRLADIAEECFLHGVTDEKAITQELGALFKHPQADAIDTIGLACTHYTFIAPQIRACAPRDVMWLDPADAVARHAASILTKLPLRQRRSNRQDELVITKAVEDDALFRNAIARYGYHAYAVEDLAT